MMTTLTRKNPPRKPRRNGLERKAIGFTIGLYLFICVALLAVHYLGPYLPQAPTGGSSSTSPFNP